MEGAHEVLGSRADAPHSGPRPSSPRPRSSAPQALHHAKAALSQMADQHKDLEARRRANLAFSGQTLVGDNLGVLQVRSGGGCIPVGAG